MGECELLCALQGDSIDDVVLKKGTVAVKAVHERLIIVYNNLHLFSTVGTVHAKSILEFTIRIVIVNVYI